MKLVPLLRFWGRRQKGEDDFLDELPEEVLQLPTEEEAENAAEEDPGEKDDVEDEIEEEEETPAETRSERDLSDGQDNLLRVFLAAEEEYADTSSLAAEMEDVSAAELLAELRAMATTLNLPSAGGRAG